MIRPTSRSRAGRAACCRRRSNESEREKESRKSARCRSAGSAVWSSLVDRPPRAAAPSPVQSPSAPHPSSRPGHRREGHGQVDARGSYLMRPRSREQHKLGACGSPSPPEEGGKEGQDRRPSLVPRTRSPKLTDATQRDTRRRDPEAALTTLLRPAAAEEASETDTETEARAVWVWVCSSARRTNEAGAAKAALGAIMFGDELRRLG